MPGTRRHSGRRGRWGGGWLPLGAMDLPTTFWRDGFVIVRGMFSRPEVAAMREAGLQLRNHSLDLLSIPELRGVLLDDRLLALVHAGDEARRE